MAQSIEEVRAIRAAHYEKMGYGVNLGTPPPTPAQKRKHGRRGKRADADVTMVDLKTGERDVQAGQQVVRNIQDHNGTMIDDDPIPTEHAPFADGTVPDTTQPTVPTVTSEGEEAPNTEPTENAPLAGNVDGSVQGADGVSEPADGDTSGQNVPSVEIPENYQELDWNDARALAKAIQPGVVANKEAAMEIIGGEVRRRKSLNIG